MKFLSGLTAVILGVVSLVLAWGLQTIWATPAEKTATVQSQVDEAPLTIISADINEVADEEVVEYTIEAAGDEDFTLMLGQTRDVEAWVGDAAHNTVSGINLDSEDPAVPELEIDFTDGVQEIPNPTGSDLWLDTQSVSGSVTQRWVQPEEGDWSLLVASDDLGPAPTEMTVEFVRGEPDSAWATPLTIAGWILLIGGLILVVWAISPLWRTPKKAPGRRAVGQPPTAAIPIVGQDENSEDSDDVRADVSVTNSVGNNAERFDEVWVDESIEHTPLQRVDEDTATQLMQTAPIGGNASFDSVDFYTDQHDDVAEAETPAAADLDATTVIAPVVGPAAVTDEQGMVGGNATYDAVELHQPAGEAADEQENKGF